MNRRIFSGSKVNRDRREAAFEQAVKQAQEKPKIPVFLNHVSLKIFSHEPLTHARLEQLLAPMSGPEYDVTIDTDLLNLDVTATPGHHGCDKDFYQ